MLSTSAYAISIQVIRELAGATRQQVCNFCSGIRTGKAFDTGCPELDHFLQQRKRFHPAPGTTVCEGCPNAPRFRGRPSIGHEKDISFGVRAYNNGRVTER